MEQILDLKIVLDRSSTTPIPAQIAEAVRRQITQGVIPPGARMPTLRELSARLKINLGTAAKSYDLLRNAGLIRSLVGSGTHVIDPRQPTGREVRREIDLSSNGAASSTFRQIWTTTIAEIAASGAMDEVRGYEPVAGTERARFAGAAFMAQGGLVTDPDEVICTNGAQHSLFAALSAALSPGDVVLADRPTFSGLIAVARLLKLVVVTISGDGDGILPAEIEAACARTKAKALFLVPCVNNPTTITLGDERRKEIVAVARRHGLIIIEDDIYGPLVDNRPATIASLYPENTFYLTGLSKAISPSMRLGFAKAPAGNAKAAEFLSAAVGATTLMINPLSSLALERWVANGQLAHLIEGQKSELKARMKIAAEELGEFGLRLPAISPHLWLPLPSHWHSEAFSEQLRTRGVFVFGGSGFAVTPREAVPAVRVSVSASPSRDELRRGLAIIAGTMRREPHLTSLSV